LRGEAAFRRKRSKSDSPAPWGEIKNDGVQWGVLSGGGKGGDGWAKGGEVKFL